MAAGSQKSAALQAADCRHEGSFYTVFERSMPPDVIRGWIPLRVEKMRQDKTLELRF